MTQTTASQSKTNQKSEVIKPWGLTSLFVASLAVLATIIHLMGWLYFSDRFIDFATQAEIETVAKTDQTTKADDKSEAILGQFGDFVGGILNPTISALTIAGLIFTIIQQQITIRLQIENNKMQRTEVATTNKTLKKTQEIADAQLEHLEDEVRVRQRLHYFDRENESLSTLLRSTIEFDQAIGQDVLMPGHSINNMNSVRQSMFASANSYFSGLSSQQKLEIIFSTDIINIDEILIRMFELYKGIKSISKDVTLNDYLYKLLFQCYVPALDIKNTIKENEHFLTNEWKDRLDNYDNVLNRLEVYFETEGIPTITEHGN